MDLLLKLAWLAGVNDSNAEQEHKKSLIAIHSAHQEAMTAVYKHPTMTSDQRKAAVTKNMEQYCRAMKDWHHTNIDLGNGAPVSAGARKLQKIHGVLLDAKSLLESGSGILKEMSSSADATA